MIAVAGGGGVTPPIGADAVVPARRTPLRALAARARLARHMLRHRGRLHAGRGVWLAPGVRITITGDAEVSLGDGVEVGDGVTIEAAGGRIAIGERTRVGERASLLALTGIDVGPDALIGDWVRIQDARVGAGARLGAHAALEPGAALRDGEVAGSYAVLAAR